MPQCLLSTETEGQLPAVHSHLACFVVSIAPCPAGTGVHSCWHRADYNDPLYSTHFYICWLSPLVRKSGQGLLCPFSRWRNRGLKLSHLLRITQQLPCWVGIVLGMLKLWIWFVINYENMETFYFFSGSSGPLGIKTKEGCSFQIS